MDDKHQKTAYPLRMPDELRRELQKEADKVGRSLNAEIVARLHQSYRVSSIFDEVGEIAAEHANALHAGDSPSVVAALTSTVARLEYQLIKHEASLSSERLYKAELATYFSRVLNLLPKSVLKSLNQEETSAFNESINAALETPADELFAEVKKATEEAGKAIKKLKDVQRRL